MCTWPLRASVADHEPVKGVCPAAYCPVCNVNVLSGRDMSDLSKAYSGLREGEDARTRDVKLATSVNGLM